MENDPHIHATQSDIDLVPAEELVGRRAHLVISPETAGQIVGVWVKLGSREYTLTWFWDGSTHSCEFYGFQLVLED